MVKQHNQMLQVCLGLCDLSVIGGAWWAAYYVRFRYFPPVNEIPSRGTVTSNMGLALLLSLVVMAGVGLYKPRRDKSFLLEMGQVLKATLITWTILIVFLFYYMTGSPFSRGMLLAFLPLMAAALVLERGLFRSLLRFVRRRGWNLRHALIVGTGRLGQSTLEKLQENSWTGIRVRGFVELFPTGRTIVRGVPILGASEDVVEIVEQTKVDCIFVALSSKHGEQLRQVIHDLEQTAADVRIIPDLFLSRFPTNIAVGELDGLPILSLRENPLAGWPAIYKRGFDIAGAVFGLMVFGLPMLAIALLVKLTSQGPIIYRQRRISVGGREFDMYKFRTMRVDAERLEGPVFATRDDPRCTRMGRWLRSTSLDELPQLLNVIKGDMSLVGPRPERPEMLAKIREELPGFPIRLKVRAGLTGWAQINGFRGRTSFRKRLQYDLYYLNHWSPMLDLRIVLATILRGFRHPNAY